jgi:alpha-L-fucosidase 2
MTFNRKSAVAAVVLLVCTVVHADGDRLWYDEPASQTPWKIVHRSKDWRQRCLPIGNGRLGGMIYGNPDKERIQFNEDTLWVGDEQFVGNSLAFADLYLAMAHEEYSDYRRELDLANAVHTITYESGGVKYKRQYFSSEPDQVMVFHFTADRKGALTGTLFLDDVYTDSTVKLAGNRITLTGEDAGGSALPGGNSKGRTVESHSLRMTKDKKRFNIRLAREAQLRVLHEGGSIRIDGEPDRLRATWTR